MAAILQPTKDRDFAFLRDKILSMQDSDPLMKVQGVRCNGVGR